jgi:hypothetical protein
MYQNELQLSNRDIERSKKYEQEIKEKNLLIGKLRHEGELQHQIHSYDLYSPNVIHRAHI